MSDDTGLARVRIGLEVHCQLTALSSKLFCSCSSDYRKAEPNSTICPICTGLPGTLPVVNRRAVDFAIMVGLALNCKISERTLFYRKNYFYPDLPKNFQISQYDKAGAVPIARDGWLETDKKRIRIKRVQLEEDPGRLSYEGTIERSSYSLVDYNRAGIALVEIVTEPDLSSPREAKAFLQKLRGTVESLGVSDGELDGAMRCDANVSLADGARVEIKNIASFKEVAKALNYEVLRQKTFGQHKGDARTETRHWDERRSITITLRSKEEEQDYMYFPEPDLTLIQTRDADIARIKSEMPELPELAAERFVREYKVPRQAAIELSKVRVLANFFDKSARLYPNRAELANWVGGDLRAYLESRASGGRDLAVSPSDFVGLLKLVDERTITKLQARDVLREMVKGGKSAHAIVNARALTAVRDDGMLVGILKKLLADEPGLLEKARRDKKAFNYVVGRVLREQPKAEPKTIAKLLASELKKRWKTLTTSQIRFRP